MPPRPPLARPRRDNGFTLIEVLIAMTLLGIVIALTTESLIQVIDRQSNISQQTSAQNQNNTGMELATRLLRQAVYPVGGTYKNSQIITAATPTQVTFTSRMSSTSAAIAGCTSTSCQTADTPVKRYTFGLQGTTLMWGSAAQTTCSGVCSYGTPTLSQPIVYGVRNAGGTSVCSNNTTGANILFRYFYIDPNGNPAEYTTFPLTTTQMGTIQYVEIDLYTQTQTGPMKPQCVALTDRVELRNWL